MVAVFFSCLLFSVSLFAQTTTLDDAFAAALSNNEGAKQSHEKVVQVKEQLDQAQSTVFPTVNLKAGYIVQPRSSNEVARQFSPREQTTVNAELKQPLFRGLREFAGIRQRKNFVSAEEQSRLNSLLNLYVEVATHYYNILALEQDSRNVNQQLELYSTRVKDLRARIRRGESNAPEALTAESTQAALEAEAQLVDSNLRTARENFQVLTGLSADSKLVDIPAASAKSTQTLEPLSAYLDRIEIRPDVKAAIENVSAAAEDVTIAKGAHWPTLDLLGNYYFQRPKGFVNDLNWDVQLQFTMPLFEGGLRTSQTREASSKKRQMESELRRLRQQASADIKSLYEALKMRGNQLSALQRSTELAEKNYEVILRDNRRGLSKSIDVQLALTEYRVGRRTFDQARYQGQLDKIRLDIASAKFPASVEKENN